MFGIVSRVVVQKPSNPVSTMSLPSEVQFDFSELDNEIHELEEQKRRKFEQELALNQDLGTYAHVHDTV